LLAVPGININIQEDNGNTALLSAIYWDDIDTVKLLLYPELFGLPNFNPPIDINVVNIFGQTPLISAVTPEKSKSPLIVHELLKQPNIVLDHKNVEGDSALMIAVKSLNVESVNLIVNKLKNSMNIKGAIEMIQEIRDHQLDAYPRKFVEDNLQICFLRQNANIDKASKTIRNYIKQNLDQNNPSVSVVNHIQSILQTMPELNNIFIKLKGLLGMKGDLHRKYIASLIGAVQVGAGGNNEDLIYNEREYSIRISTRFNDKWGKVDLGKWSLREDDPERYLTEPEQKRMEEGSPEEKDVLRRRVVMEAIAETFKKRSFMINVVGQDGTLYTLGWDMSGSLKNAYTTGKLIVKTIQSDNSEAMIDDDGAIIPYVDIKIKYVKDAEGGVDEDGKPAKEEHDFMERIDGMLFLTCQLNILKEAASSFGGIVLKETPYTGNPSDLNVLMRCVPSAGEILLRNC
jgi:hypothetical protein